MSNYRTERDSLGEVRVPENALYQAQTQRARENFRISDRQFPFAVIRALLDLKAAAASVNRDLGLLDAGTADAIRDAVAGAALLDFPEQFPLDVFQTGSGTSSNMNVNEVLATLASRALGTRVHPNDHVNLGQSSNDIIPTAIQVAVVRLVRGDLDASIAGLAGTLRSLADRFRNVVKTGRTHLMDAMPVTFGQEFETWENQLMSARSRIVASARELEALPLGGTAVGTGVNTHVEFAGRVCAELSAKDGDGWRPAPLPAALMGGQEHTLAMMSALKSLAVVLMKISNDLRWMNSGPVAGLGEIRLAALQPGSSIMPGKVNPVIPEAVAMVCVEVIGNETAVTLAAQSGNFQLNVMLPLIADKMVESIRLLAGSCRSLSENGLGGIQVDDERAADAVSRNPMLATALNAVVGYDQAARIAKRAWEEGRAVVDVAEEETGLPRAQLEALLDPLTLCRRSNGETA